MLRTLTAMYISAVASVRDGKAAKGTESHVQLCCGFRQRDGKAAKGTESNAQLCCGFRQNGRRLYDRRLLLPSQAQAGVVQV